MGAVFQKHIYRDVKYKQRCLKDVNEHPKSKTYLFHNIIIVQTNGFQRLPPQKIVSNIDIIYEHE